MAVIELSSDVASALLAIRRRTSLAKRAIESWAQFHRQLGPLESDSVRLRADPGIGSGCD
jgi:hypothetical protein